MPTAYILVGVPASGKTSWIREQKWAKDCVEISTDYYIEYFAKQENKTYSEAFDKFMPKAIEFMFIDVNTAVEFNQDIIWDQTSTTIASRKKKFKMLEGYTMIAIVFNTPEPEEHQRRLSSRPGKIIPDDAVQRMIRQFEMPTEEEGFDEIWYT